MNCSSFSQKKNKQKKYWNFPSYWLLNPFLPPTSYTFDGVQKAKQQNVTTFLSYINYYAFYSGEPFLSTDCYKDNNLEFQATVVVSGILPSFCLLRFFSIIRFAYRPTPLSSSLLLLFFFPLFLLIWCCCLSSL